MKPVLGYVWTLCGVLLLALSVLCAGDNLSFRGGTKHTVAAVAAVAGAGSLVLGWANLRVRSASAGPPRADAPARIGKSAHD